ncbi:uncharacterized protein LOC121943495 [Plectropomus leopardus]|uniref:uncharacterized protein LOC121943495 n=1 Tax=Plectropomus leopardus TaxID=160734 RepID=UPI001C4D1942|nr:uncharacterized protein LOC121943495 [Plectropomus leopardus]
MGAGTSPESSEADSVLRKLSPLSSDSGRGGDCSGPAVTTYRFPTESAHRPDSDCLSSTTISTGSYITTDPEQNVNTDKSLPLRHHAEQGQRADFLIVSSPSGQSSAAGHPGLVVDSLFNDSSIQNIIDRYTRELNISLSSAGKTIESEGSYVEDPGSSVSQQSLVRVSERSEEDESSTPPRSPPSDTAGAQRSGLERYSTVNPTVQHFSDEDPSLTENQEHDSFRPLIGHLTDQSSCLAADQRDSAMEQLVGQPSAHSSIIGQLPGASVSVSLDQGGWDSTLSHMIGRLSHQSSSHWLSGGQDFYAGQLMGQLLSEQSTTWLDEGPEESRMRPLVGELDESAGQHSGSSDDRTRVDLGVSAGVSGPSHPALPPEASSHSASALGFNPHPQDQTRQNQSSPVDLGPERTEVFPGSDSFHPLLAEVTHNETTDPSMTFHLPEHGVPSSPEGQPASGERSVSTPSHTDASAESEPSPERLRTEEPSNCTAVSPALPESFSQLITSQCHPYESVLEMSPTMRMDVELTTLSLSNLTVCDDTVGMLQPEGADADGNCGDSVPLSDLCPLSEKLLKMMQRQFLLMKQQDQLPDYLTVRDMKTWLLTRRSFLEE